jgi:hypothetical protein
MLRLLLPPNLAAAAPRDAIAVKIEWNPSVTPAPALFPALAVLQRLCGGATTPPPFVQLTRAQLRELVTALKGQSAFAFVNAPTSPLLWIGPRLRGVSPRLSPLAPRLPLTQLLSPSTAASTSSPSASHPANKAPTPPLSIS